MAILPFVSTAAARDATTTRNPSRSQRKVGDREWQAASCWTQGQRHESGGPLRAQMQKHRTLHAAAVVPLEPLREHRQRTRWRGSAKPAARNRRTSSHARTRRKAAPTHPRPAESRHPTPAPRNQAPRSQRTKKVRPAHAGRTLTLSSDNRRRCVHRVTQAAPRWSREPPPPR